MTDQVSGNQLSRVSVYTITRDFEGDRIKDGHYSSRAEAAAEVQRRSHGDPAILHDELWTDGERYYEIRPLVVELDRNGKREAALAKLTEEDNPGADLSRPFPRSHHPRLACK